MSKRTSFLFLIVASLLMAGCRGAPTLTEARETTATPTLLPVTVTPSPSAISPPATTTSSPTHTLTPKLTVTPTITLTPLPSLEPLEAEKAIRQLLKQDVECPAPCFWGIIPGQTTVEEAVNIYSRLNMDIQSSSLGGGQEFYEAKFRFMDGFRVYTLNLVQDGIVQGIKVMVNNSKDTSPPEDWFAYAPQTLLKRYGLPSEVNFNAFAPHEPGSPIDYYDMVMFFKNSNLVVYYRDGPTNVGDLMNVCPLEDFSDGVVAWLGENPPEPPTDGVPLEKATTLTKEQFYDLLTQDSGEACFNLIADALR